MLSETSPDASFRPLATQKHSTSKPPSGGLFVSGRRNGDASITETVTQGKTTIRPTAA
jgi:hypothetical protein